LVTETQILSSAGILMFYAVYTDDIG